MWPLGGRTTVLVGDPSDGSTSGVQSVGTPLTPPACAAGCDVGLNGDAGFSDAGDLVSAVVSVMVLSPEKMIQQVACRVGDYELALFLAHTLVVSVGL